MITSAPMPAALTARPATRPIAVGAVGLLLVAVLGLAVGGEARGFVVAGLPAIALAGGGVLARLGGERRWARISTLVLGAVLVAGLGAGVFAISAASLVGDGSAPPTPAAALKLVLLVVGLTAGGLLGLLGLVPRTRRALAAFLPLDPSSFPAGVGAATVLATTAMAAVPLLVLATPPLLTVIASAPEALADGGGMLRQTVYSLFWLVPGVAIAAGWGLGRDWRAAMVRLGVVRPTARQIAAGLAVAAALAAGSRLLSFGVGELWAAAGWPRTDGALVNQLFGFALNPLGALVVGVTAGLTEELIVRGLLQPRVGLLFANLCFTLMHGLQYGWDALVVVFALGAVLGLLRSRTNTTTSALAHTGYDILLMIYAMATGGEV